MTVTKKYASTVDFDFGWNNSANALGVEDNSCSDSSSVDPLNNLDLLFAFNLPSNAVISEVLIDCKVACSFGNYLAINLWNGVSFLILAEIDGSGRPICATTAYLGAKDVTAHLNTPAKVNACLARFHHASGTGGGIPWTAYVDACWLQVTYTVAKKIRWTPHAAI